jgi:hypothetical protein
MPSLRCANASSTAALHFGPRIFFALAVRQLSMFNIIGRAASKFGYELFSTKSNFAVRQRHDS